MTRRLFFALWPNAATRRLCQSAMLSVGDYGKAVDPANLHVTLLFLGAIEPDQQQLLSTAAANLAVARMSLVFDRISYWQKPAVCCLTSASYDKAVNDLAQQLQSIAGALGLPVDHRALKPHVTLLRKAVAMPDRFIQPIVWESEQFCLVESQTKPTGVMYRVLESWP